MVSAGLKEDKFVPMVRLAPQLALQGLPDARWIEDYASKHAHPKAPGAVVFTIAGDNKLPEQTLDHWEGYRGSGPVHRWTLDRRR